LLVAIAGDAQGLLEVTEQLITSPVLKVPAPNATVVALVPTTLPFLFQTYTGDVPGLLATAVKMVLLPLQMVELPVEIVNVETDPSYAVSVPNLEYNCEQLAF
jgi:hypothetical protein